MARHKQRSPTRTRHRVVINDRSLSPAQERLWRAANADLASGDFQRMHQGLERLRGLEAVLETEQLESEVRTGLDDTVALALARGEKIEISQQPETMGRVRVRTRDGLETLARAGAISETQFKAGMIYRELYEAADPERDLRSQMSAPSMTIGGGRSQPGSGPVETWAERRLRLAQSLAVVEARVRRCECGDRGLRALRQVAGYARAISTFVSGGGGQAAHRAALVRALDAVGEHFNVG